MNSEREERKKGRGGEGERERDRGAIRGRRVFHAAVGACARIHTHIVIRGKVCATPVSNRE